MFKNKNICMPVLFLFLLIFLSLLYGETLYLPPIKEFTFDGKTIDTKSFKGELVYVQFINPKSQDQIDLLKKVYNDFIKDNLLVSLVFVNNLRIFLNNFGEVPDNLYVIDQNYSTYKSLFSVPLCCEACFLFNKDSKLLFKFSEFYNYEKHVKPLIISILHNRDLTLSPQSHFEGHFIFEFPWLFRFVDDIELASYRFSIISFHPDVCTSCPSGMIIKYLNQLNNKNTDIYVASIVSSDFTDNDIENLKDHLHINYDLFRDDGYLSEQLNEIFLKYGNPYMGNVIFIIDNSGIILKTFCCDQFYIEKFIKYMKDYIRRNYK